MMRSGLLAALSLMLAGHPVLAQEESAETTDALPYVEVPVNLNGVDYVTVIDLEGGMSMLVNGVQLDEAPHVPGAVRVAKADGTSMADEGYRAREVLTAACATQGRRADPASVPVLTPAGRWVFPQGCL